MALLSARPPSNSCDWLLLARKCFKLAGRHLATYFDVVYVHCTCKYLIYIYIFQQIFLPRDFIKLYWLNYFIPELTPVLPVSVAGGRVPCPHCFGLITRLNLAKHIRTRHTVAANPVACPQCAKTFKNAYNMKDHLRKSHAIWQRETTTYFSDQQ